jgi:ATPase, P-type (transporting), HAD superfamily, subfamily IC
VFEAFLTAVSLAVAAIPEGLVVVVTVLLSIGVTRMSSRNAIIRKMTAVETLGSTEVICSDKTGTLTQNKMTVVEHFGDEDLLSTAMALCNDSGYDADGDLVGDPTETALVVWAESLGKKELSDQYPRIAEVPFDSERKMMSTLHQVSDGVRQFTKGAPDEVLAHCDWALIDGKVVEMTNVLRQQILDANKQMADKALRVLGGAYRDYPRLPEDLSDKAVEQQMTFVGLAGMIDPVRDEVKAAIGSCKSAGVRAVMITGDHRDTAVAIAKELGILHRPDQAITGAQLSQMSDEEFKNRIADIVVYARVQPEDKVRIVKAWKEKGKVTAMTGDGVNDAPAIKSADIGVGMGITGTDVTKNVADMVLSDDNFATIVYAVEEGRRIYENIRKAVQFLLASNLAEVIAILIATLAGWRLFAPIHILWINLITDTFPAMALGMEKAEPDSMKKPPRPAKESIFASGLGIGVIYQGVTVAVLTLLSFFIGASQSHVTGMTMAFLTLSMCEVFHSFNMRSRNESLFSIKGQNKYLWGAALLAAMLTFAVIYIPGLNTVFQLTALSVADFFVAFGFAAAILPLVEIVKFFQRRITKSRLSA